MTKTSKNSTELEEFQSNIKYKLSYISSIVSILLIIIGLYLLITGIYKLSFKDESVIVDNEYNSITDVIIDNGFEVEDNSDIGEAISTGRVQAESLTAIEKSEINQRYIRDTGKWRATDYSRGDIGIGEYEVKLGDTLWEISEAVYGSGFEWKRILNANSDKIGFLKDGSQALIIPGQILKIYTN